MAPCRRFRTSRALPTAPESAPEGAQPSLLRAPRSSPALQKPMFSLRKTLISHFNALPTFCERAAADCNPPAGTLGYNLAPPAPAPGPGEITFTYCFQPSFLYLLASNTCLLVDRHATSLVPRGRRIRKGCALGRRPREKKTTSSSSSNFNKVEVTLNLHHFQPVPSKFFWASPWGADPYG